MVGRIIQIHKIEVKLESIDLNLILSGIVLQNSCQETLGEEETWEPEHLRGPLVSDPLLKRLYAKSKITDVAGKRLKSWVGELKPAIRHKTLDKLESDLGQLLSHQDLTVCGLFQVL